MVRLQCPNCGSYNLVSCGYLYLNESTGQAKVYVNPGFSNGLLMLAVLNFGLGCIAFLFTCSAIAYFYFAVAAVFGYLQSLRRTTPAGYTKYAELDCLTCNHEWRQSYGNRTMF